MNVTRFFFGLLIISAAVFFLSGCNKKDTTTKYTNVSWASDNALAEGLYGDTKDWSDKAMSGVKLKSTAFDTVYMGTCVLATLDLSVLPYKLTIDFGSTDCKCDDNIYRRGKMFVTFTGDYWTPGTVITYTFDNYFVNDNQILGTKTITNKGVNASNNLYWTIVVAGEIIKANNGGTIYWNSNTTMEWFYGDATPTIWWDDVYHLTGSESGTGADGKTYTVTITSPLSRRLNCKWIESGTMDIQPQDYPLITVDFGDGTCDNQATATVAGVSYTITMP